MDAIISTHQAQYRIYARVNHDIGDSNNGVSPVPHQAITWTNACIYSMAILGSNRSEISFEM